MVVPLADFSVSPQNEKESDLNHLDDLSDIICSHDATGGGALECQGGYQARPNIHVIRVVF